MRSEDVKLDKSLTKLLNTEIFKDIYPMIDNVEVYDIDLINTLFLVIKVKDPEMTRDNMYQKGLDPHYLIDRHLVPLLPYFGVPRSKRIGFKVLGPENNFIHNYTG